MANLAADEGIELLDASLTGELRRKQHPKIGTTAARGLRGMGASSFDGVIDDAKVQLHAVDRTIHCRVSERSSVQYHQA